MKVLLIGSGGREHALAYKIAKSESLEKLYVMPGNPGTESLGENVEMKTDNDTVLAFCKDKSVDLIVIGPEQPLVDGLADMLRKKGFKVFGPSAKAARIEGDKVFSKELMKKYNIPTAAYEIFERSQYEKAKNYLTGLKYPTVIKAFGLAAGKGVLICNNKEEAEEGLNQIFKENAFGSAGDKIVIEEFMTGEEASVFAVTDGENYVALPPAQDHKRIFNNDEGKNTGGMGAYTPAPVMTDELQQRVRKEIIEPTLRAMKSEDSTFSGCLYCGLMITTEGPKVVEFNCRFGDPEAQVVLPVIEGDFLKLLYSAAEGKLNPEYYEYNGASAVCVVAASQGYPDKYEKGIEITGLEDKDDDIIIFHAGTKKADRKIVTSGGRVLGITAINKSTDIMHCKKRVYEAISKVNFEGMQYRTDISDKAMKYLGETE